MLFLIIDEYGNISHTNEITPCMIDAFDDGTLDIVRFNEGVFEAMAPGGDYYPVDAADKAWFEPPAR